MNPQDIDLVPSLHDQHSDANAGSFGFADEPPVQDADAFGPEPEYTPQEEQEMYGQYLARREADAKGEHAAATRDAAYTDEREVRLADARFHDAMHSTGVAEGEAPDFTVLSERQLGALVVRYFTRGDDYAESMVSASKAELERRRAAATAA